MEPQERGRGEGKEEGRRERRIMAELLTTPPRTFSISAQAWAPLLPLPLTNTHGAATWQRWGGSNLTYRVTCRALVSDSKGGKLKADRELSSYHNRKSLV